MAVQAYLPNLGTVIVTALIDSINPCAIGVLILLISMLVVYKSKSDLLKYGLIYIFFVFFTYLLAGLGLLYFLTIIPLYLSEYISIAVGVLVVAAGLIEIKDFFWYGRGLTLSIPSDKDKKIYEMSRKITFPAMIVLGVFVAGVELPCTGGPYLAILVFLSQNFNFQALMLLIFYNIIFVMPLVVILLMVYFGMKVQHLKRWKQDNRGYMRFAMGIILIFLGWLLILIANGTVNLG